MLLIVLWALAQADPLLPMLFPHTLVHLATPTPIPGVGLDAPSSGKPSPRALFSAPPRRPGYQHGPTSPQLSARIGGPISVLVARMRASARTPTG